MRSFYIRIDIEGADEDAGDILDHVLDHGDFQEAYETYARDYRELNAKVTRCEIEIAEPPAPLPSITRVNDDECCIDPVHGDDNAPGLGTKDHPLKTFAEFRRRLERMTP